MQHRDLYLFDGVTLLTLRDQPGRYWTERACSYSSAILEAVLEEGPSTEWPWVNPPELLAAIRVELARRPARSRPSARRAFATACQVRAGRRWLEAAFIPGRSRSA